MIDGAIIPACTSRETPTRFAAPKRQNADEETRHGWFVTQKGFINSVNFADVSKRVPPPSTPFVIATPSLLRFPFPPSPHLCRGEGRPERFSGLRVVRVHEGFPVVQHDRPDADGPLLDLEARPPPLGVAQECAVQTAAAPADTRRHSERSEGRD